jgi:hypothetical protein
MSDARLPAAAPEAEESGLSCYTASIARYLRTAYRDPLARVARSIRLAVRTDLPDGLLAFSHHRFDLADLGDGRRLQYRHAATAEQVPDRLDRELTAAGQVIAVTYTGELPWSPARPAESAPHFVLVEARQGDLWRVADPFAALLPAGRQEPFAGWLSTRRLLAAMTPPDRVAPEHRSRLALAFGVPATPPRPGRPAWVAPTPVEGRLPPIRAGWITRPDQVMDILAAFWTGLADHPDRSRFVDDMWAAAQHHCFRSAYLADRCRLTRAERGTVAAAAEAWQGLPMALRFAADSVARGRARPTLVVATFDRLRRVENDMTDVLATHRAELAGSDSTIGDEPAHRHGRTA